ncbi:MIP/aquaporin family protein [Arsenicicoccus dermatophilus]|uniref:MIP/aquaporin family protein n=1 Tax=Arsenicicoccus dermatophilus TaxID=1076331 RepID=UPI001F4CD9A1|nr:aquaporin [Arsenicicoccus dermatophilus]MCH8613383.1 aquaporin [Arsenicicoccus dermatophilus]
MSVDAPSTQEVVTPVEHPELSLRSPLVEGIGTFFLVLTIGCAVLGRSPLAPLGIGAMLMCMVFAGGHVSGAHFNPAVSLAAVVRGRLTPVLMGQYWLAQLVGGLLGAMVATFVTHRHGAVAPMDLTAAAIVEFLFTFALCWVVLNVATSRNHPGNHFYGVAIGFTVLAGAVAVGSVSGAAFNPAVAVALVLMGLLGVVPAAVFVVVELLGAVVAALAFRAVHRGDR